MHRTINSVEEAQAEVANRASHLMGLFFLMRHFGPEYVGPADTPNLTDLATGIRSVGDLGSEISDGLFGTLLEVPAAEPAKIEVVK